MNSFYSEEELLKYKFKYLGNNVKLSRKASIYNENQISIGDNTRIDDFCILSGNIQIGNYVHISAFSALYGGQEGIDIGDFVALSTRTTVFAVSDDYSGKFMTNPTVDAKYTNIYEKKVVISRHAILGAGCVVLPGVYIGEGSAFGSMSLINRESEAWSIYVGIPACKIKERHEDIKILEKKFIMDK